MYRCKLEVVLTGDGPALGVYFDQQATTLAGAIAAASMDLEEWLVETWCNQVPGEPCSAHFLGEVTHEHR